MKIDMQVERATHGDLGAIRSCYADGRVIQHKTGSPQWPMFTDAAIIAEIDSGALYRVGDRKELVGVFSAVYNDEPIWGGLERNAHIYLHRIARSLSYRGRGLVDAVILWALARAEAIGREGLRMDTWASNDTLIAYYAKRGFALVGTRHIPHDSRLSEHYRGIELALLERRLDADFASALRKLTDAELQSLGEYIFETYARDTLNARVEPMHSGRVAFMVNATPVHVATSIRYLTESFPELSTLRVTRAGGVRFAWVDFAPQGARVALEAGTTTVLTWAELREMWQRWVVYSTPSRAEVARSQLQIIRAEISSCLLSYGYKARIIYRTVQAEFGDESPANLLPSEIQLDRVTVYLDFEDSSLTQGSIRTIYAFPDSAAEDLPLLERTRLHLPKVDLAKMPAEYVFARLSAFLDDIQRIF